MKRILVIGDTPLHARRSRRPQDGENITYVTKGSKRIDPDKFDEIIDNTTKPKRAKK